MWGEAVLKGEPPAPPPAEPNLSRYCIIPGLGRYTVMILVYMGLEYEGISYGQRIYIIGQFESRMRLLGLSLIIIGCACSPQPNQNSYTMTKEDHQL